MRVDVLLPSPEVRRLVRDELGRFFKTEKPEHFDTAVAALCGYYGLPSPRVTWVEKFGKPGIAGYCNEDGTLELMVPARWKRCTKYKSLRLWRHTTLHELGHYVLWADRETKADAFANGMLK